ncbi:MAG: SulP family inorganic anion transporter [Polyangiaceae bacterium]
MTARVATAVSSAPPSAARARYGAADLRRDAVAGVTVAAISLPQAMAYALIAGVDPRFGLYSAIVVTAIASALGSSSHLINGPTNAISLVVFSALAFFDPDARLEAYQATFVLAVMAGAFQILIAVTKLGDLTRYISESVVLGFMAGAGLLVALGQVGNLLGLVDKGTGHQPVIVRLWLTLTSHDGANPRSVTIGVVTIVLVVALRRVLVRYRLPRVDMLGALVLASALSTKLGWSVTGAGGKTLVAVIGRVPAELPAFHVPEIKFWWVKEMAGSALAISILGLLEALAIAKSIAHETRQRLDFNRQCLAEGLANLGGGFFQCLPGSGSLTRSAINYQAGAVTRASGLFAAAAVAAVVALFAPLARFVPKPALAGLLMVTAARLIDWRRMGYALRASFFDAGLVFATAFAAVFVSVEFSILIGVALSIVMFVPRAARLKVTELAVAADRTIRGRQPGDPACKLLVIYDFEGELFFGAAPELDRYLDDLRARIAAGARVVVLRLRRTRIPDLVCMERLEHFLKDVESAGAVALLSGVGVDVARTMKNLRFDAWLPADRVFPWEPDSPGSSTIKAVRLAHQLLGPDARAACHHCAALPPPDGDLYYVV